MDVSVLFSQAWIETVALNFHCETPEECSIPLHHGDDAVAVQWLEVCFTFA